MHCLVVFHWSWFSTLAIVLQYENAYWHMFFAMCAECLIYYLMFLLLFYVKGFVFSESEHTALEQFEGGPCAVIAPVQVLLKLYKIICAQSQLSP